MPSTVAEIVSDVTHWLGLGLSWFRIKILRRRPPPITGFGHITSSGIGSMRGRVTTAPGKDWDLEQRIAWLERTAVDLQDTIGRVEDQYQERLDELSKVIAEEGAARERASIDLRALVKEAAVGGLRLESVGLVWLLIGLALTTWSQELAQLLSFQ